MKLVLALIFSCIFITAFSQPGNLQGNLPPWQTGMLDIHFINTGRGNASFLIFPDGTTMLVDAGDINAGEFAKANSPLKLPPAFPDNSLRPGQYIAAYIKQVMPFSRKPTIDYALLTHFHGDHYGAITKSSPISANGTYQLSGLTEVGDIIPIIYMIDRGYPEYNFPVNLKKYYAGDLTFNNYLAFINYHTVHNGMKAASLKPGSMSQIRLLYDPGKYKNFAVRNIKSNASVWTGQGDAFTSCFSMDQLLNGYFNENTLSNAIKINYGPFSYYVGGDNTGYQGSDFPGRVDVETPMAKVIGSVEAMTLDHHGNRDASNDFFLKTLSPKIIIEQSWCSDQPGQELSFRLARQSQSPDSALVFATYIQPETRAYLGFWINDTFKSLQGNILIRVMEGGRKYFVYILDDREASIKLLRVFGPFSVRK